MPFNTRNPIPSGDLRDLDDNARNIDTWANDKTKLSHPDRFGVERYTWHGLEQKAKLDIAAGVAEATAEAEQYRDQALDAKNAAQEAAMMSGFSKYADTLAQLEAGIGTDYVDGDVVMVFQDESRNDASSIYKVESGVAVFQNVFDKTRQDLLSFTGNISADAEWSDVPAHSDPAFDVQAKALANQSKYLLKNAAIKVIDYGELRSYTGGVMVADITKAGIAGRFICKGVVPNSTDNGGTAIKDGLGRLWEREYKGAILASWFGDGVSGVTAALNSVMGAVVETNDSTLTGTITVGNYDKLDGLMKGYGSRLNGQVVMNGVLSTLENYQIDSTTGVPAVHCNPANNATFYQTIRDLHINGPEGLLVNSTEAVIDNVRVIGRGRENVGAALTITKHDASVHNFYSERVQMGVVTNKGINGTDIHVVRAEQAFRLSESQQPTQLHQVYLDHPERFGINLIDNNNAAIDSVYVLNAGDGWVNNTEPAAFNFQLNSRYNKISKVTFQQSSNTAQDLLKFSAESYNNVLYGFGGSYVLTQAQRARMRQQTVIGCTEGWARHNNITRKCRANVENLDAGATAELVFRLDWSFPELSYNTTLFKGVYVSRNTYSHASVGEAWIPIQHGDTGCPPTLYKKMGASTDAWSIVSATLEGNLLKVVVRNDGAEHKGSIAIELERCIDTRGQHF